MRKFQPLIRKRLILFILLLIFFSLIEYIVINEKMTPKTCKSVEVYSTGGDIIACREGSKNITRSDRIRCDNRFAIESEIANQYQRSKCKLKGFLSKRNPHASGCLEFCEFICCDK